MSDAFKAETFSIVQDGGCHLLKFSGGGRMPLSKDEADELLSLLASPRDLGPVRELLAICLDTLKVDSDSNVFLAQVRADLDGSGAQQAYGVVCCCGNGFEEYGEDQLAGVGTMMEHADGCAWARLNSAVIAVRSWLTAAQAGTPLPPINEDRLRNNTWKGERVVSDSPTVTYAPTNTAALLAWLKIKSALCGGGRSESAKGKEDAFDDAISMIESGQFAAEPDLRDEIAAEIREGRSEHTGIAMALAGFRGRIETEFEARIAREAAAEPVAVPDRLERAVRALLSEAEDHDPLRVTWTRKLVELADAHSELEHRRAQAARDTQSAQRGVPAQEEPRDNSAPRVPDNPVLSAHTTPGSGAGAPGTLNAASDGGEHLETSRQAGSSDPKGKIDANLTRAERTPLESSEADAGAVRDSNAPAVDAQSGAFTDSHIPPLRELARVLDPESIHCHACCAGVAFTDRWNAWHVSATGYSEQPFVCPKAVHGFLSRMACVQDIEFQAKESGLSVHDWVSRFNAAPKISVSRESVGKSASASNASGASQTGVYIEASLPADAAQSTAAGTSTPARAAGEPEGAFVDVVFDGPPSHESGRFVEVEDSKGRSISLGEWVHRADGFWALRFQDPREPAPAAARSEPASPGAVDPGLLNLIDQYRDAWVRYFSEGHNPALREVAIDLARQVRLEHAALQRRVETAEADQRETESVLVEYRREAGEYKSALARLKDQAFADANYLRHAQDEIASLRAESRRSVPVEALEALPRKRLTLMADHWIDAADVDHLIAQARGGA